MPGSQLTEPLVRFAGVEMSPVAHKALELLECDLRILEMG